MTNYYDWAQAHQIQLIGTQQHLSDLYRDGFDSSKVVEASQVPYFSDAMEALMLLPDHLLAVMEPQYNEWSKKTETKAIYFSIQPFEGQAIDLPYGYSNEVFAGVYPGIILGQGRISMGVIAVHELGHLIDRLWLRSWYYWRPPSAWGGLTDEVNRIFDAKGILLESANKDIWEDFAVHFHSYVRHGVSFRSALSNPDLAERYSFLKNYIFQGIEYEAFPATIEGNISDTVTGLPIAGAFVYSKSGLMATTDNQGYFEVSIIPGQYTIWAVASGYVDSTPTPILCEGGQHYIIGFGLLPEKAPEPIVEPEPVIVEGDVWDLVTSEAITGAYIYFYFHFKDELKAITNQMGHFKTSVLPGTYEVRCEKDDYDVSSLLIHVVVGQHYRIGFGLALTEPEEYIPPEEDDLPPRPIPVTPPEESPLSRFAPFITMSLGSIVAWLLFIKD